MLVLSRQQDETIMIGDDIEITVVDIRGDKVRLGISAPSRIAVHRKEVYLSIIRENEQAAKIGDENASPLAPPRLTPSAPPQLAPAAGGARGAPISPGPGRLRVASALVGGAARKQDRGSQIAPSVTRAITAGKVPRAGPPPTTPPVQQSSIRKAV
jgi:carbon storage regulator